MISWTGLKALSTLPVYLLVALFKYLIYGGPYRKYKNSLLKTLTLVSVVRFFKMSVPDYGTILTYGGDRLINKMVPLVAKDMVKGLPGYGKRYDKNAIWLVKNDEIKTNPVIIYLHGGGYFVQALVPQIKGILAMYKLLDDSVRQKTSILHLDYQLASRGYALPYQTNQLIETYEGLLEQGHTNIVLIGDSAGGHMILSFLQFLKSRETAIIYPRNIVLISPWVNLLARKEQYQVNNSYYDNKTYDYLSYDFFSSTKNIGDIVGKSSLQNILINPGRQPLNRADWQDIPSLNNETYNIFIIVGEDEVFRDDIMEFAQEILHVPKKPLVDSQGIYNKIDHSYIRNEIGKAHLRLYIEPWGVHDASLIMEHRICSELKTKKLSELNHDEYFGIVKIVEYLNDTL